MVKRWYGIDADLELLKMRPCKINVGFSFKREFKFFFWKLWYCIAYSLLDVLLLLSCIKLPNIKWVHFSKIIKKTR